MAPARSEPGVLSVDPRMFSKDVVLAASYTLLDKAHFILGMDKKTGNIKVKLVPRCSQPLDELVLAFNDQLVNFAVYYRRAQDTAELKRLLVGTALYAIDDGG
jgi:His-Xaa-Ser system protein HxsD